MVTAPVVTVGAYNVSPLLIVGNTIFKAKLGAYSVSVLAIVGKEMT